MNKLRLNPLRSKGFPRLFLRPQEGELLGTGWVSGEEDIGTTAASMLDLLSESKG